MNTIFPCILAALALGQIGPNSPLVGSEWPAYRGDAGLSGVSPDPTIKPPFKLVWSYRLDGDASSDAGAGVTVAGGKVFVNVHNTRSILALDARTGRYIWEYRDTPIGYMTVPTYAEGKLFLWQRQAKKAAIVVVDATNGKELRSQPLNHEGMDTHRTGLPVHAGKVYCSEGGDDASVSAFDITTGDLAWRTSLGKEDGTAVVCPVAVGGKVFVATRSTHVWKNATTGATFALDAASGKILWTRKGVYPRFPLASDGQIVACPMYLSADERFHLLDAKTGETLWNAPRRFHYAPTTITDDLLLIKVYGGDIHAVERKSGKPLWHFQGKTGSGCCSPSVAGGFAYVGLGHPPGGDLEGLVPFSYGSILSREKGLSGSLHAIDLKTGKTAWYFGTGNTICGEPALAYGRLYFASRDGCVYCFAPAKDGEPTTPEAVDKSESATLETVVRLLDPKFADRPRPGRDWPMLGGSPDRAGIVGIDVKPPLELAWKFPTGDRIVTGGVIRDGRAFVGSDNGKIYALNLASLEHKRPEDSRDIMAWQFATGAAIRCTPAVAGGLVYCGSDDGQFYALEQDTGKKRWSFTAGGPVRGSPVIVGGIVLFGANDHNLYALDRVTGKKLWSFRTNDYCVQIPPVVHGERVFCAQWTELLYALDLRTGKELWRSYVPISVEALAYYRDRLWVRNVHYLVELDPATGKRLRLGDASWGWGGMAFLKNNLYVSGIQSQYGRSGATRTDLDEVGKEMTKIPTLEGVRRLPAKGMANSTLLAAMGTPQVVGDLICFASVKGKVALTEPDGKERWSYQLGGTCHATPVAADGFLVVGCDDGHVYAFRAK